MPLFSESNDFPILRKFRNTNITVMENVINQFKLKSKREEKILLFCYKLLLIYENEFMFISIIENKKYWIRKPENWEINIDNKNIWNIKNFEQFEHLNVFHQLNNFNLSFTEELIDYFTEKINSFKDYDANGYNHYRLGFFHKENSSIEYINSYVIALCIIHDLISHLFCKYEINNFLFYIWVYKTTIRKSLYLQLFITIANGNSLYKNLNNIFYEENNNKYKLPFVTKKQCSDFLNLKTSYGSSIDKEILKILISSNGGSNQLIICLNNLIFQNLSNLKYQNFVYEIIKWFCKIEKEIPQINNKIQNKDFDPIFDYLFHCFENIPNYSLKGRTYKSILKAMEIWHKKLSIKEYSHYPQIWGHSQIQNFILDNYTITEILSIEELYQEGKELHHCVLSYIKKIHEEKSTIWSLKKNGVRQLTIEINANKFIVQVRGLKNRFATWDESIILNDWIAIESLEELKIDSIENVFGNLQIP